MRISLTTVYTSANVAPLVSGNARGIYYDRIDPGWQRNAGKYQ